MKVIDTSGMKSPTYVYHPDCLEGKIVPAAEVPEMHKKGWVSNHLEARKMAESKNGEPNVENTAEPTSYDNMKIGELKELCSKRDIPVPPTYKKADIIKLLVATDDETAA